MSDMDGHRPLPNEARHKLGQLVTEVNGVARLLRDDAVEDDTDMGSALGLWLERIANDLGELECRRFPEEAAR